MAGNNRTEAFTLAEVLITLAIIGIVAAMTIPTLISKYEKAQTISKLKKVYSTLSQAFELSQIENGEFSHWDLTPTSNPKEYVMKYWAPYLKVLKYCDTYQECGYNVTRPWVSISGETAGEDLTATNVRYALILQDGVVVSFRTLPDTLANGHGTAKLNIDINGAKAPNRSGRDYFSFEIFNNKLRAYHGNLNDCNINEYGSTCLDKIITDGWQIKDDYPW